MTEQLHTPASVDKQSYDSTDMIDDALAWLEHSATEHNTGAAADHEAVESPAPALEIPVDDTDSPASSPAGRVLQRSADFLANASYQADVASEYVRDTSERTRTLFRRIGGAALRGASIAVGTGLLAGDSILSGAKAAGAKAESGAQSVKASYQSYQFNRETKANQRSFEKSYRKETKLFDAMAAEKRKVEQKEEKFSLKLAARDDKRFERAMQKKVTQERRAARRAKFASHVEGVKTSGANGMNALKESYANGAEATKAYAERSKRRARLKRTAARVALQSYRDTNEAFKAYR